VPLPYYARLSRRDKATYRRSDAITTVPLTRPERHADGVAAIAAGLVADDRGAVQRASRALVEALREELGAGAVIVRILARRPGSETEELHGSYEREDDETPVIRVWMRTSSQRRPVAFRTFLRTLLHELCHHLDYECLRLADSLHTEGFFRRESSLLRQLAGAPQPRARRAGPPPSAGQPPPSPQLALPGLD
jgi:hypothetical protein